MKITPYSTKIESYSRKIESNSIVVESYSRAQKHGFLLINDDFHFLILTIKKGVLN
ncbi:MAG: hypothetical protein H6Q15_1066 [Bacteroidetes bacterium]|nr:hypothetical protein [Bacteroidota bacterium]